MGTQETPDSAVAESASTSAEAGAAETTPAIEAPAQTDPSADPWDNFDKVEGEESSAQEQPGADEEPASTATKEADEAPDDESELLADLFKDEDEAADPDAEPVPEETDEEKLDKLDPADMANSQRNKAAKQYLERTERYAQPLKDLKAGRLAPVEALKALEPILGSEPLAKLRQAAAHELVDANPDQTFARAYAIKMLAKDPNWDPKTAPSLDDIIAGPVTPAEATAVDLSDLTKDMDGVVDWDWRDESLDSNFTDERELTMAKTMRGLEAQAKQATADKVAAEQKAAEADAKVKAVERTQQTDEQKQVADGLDTRIKTFRSSVDSKILPHVLRDTGLEVSTDDTPEIVALKQRLGSMYQGTEYEQANGIPSQFESFLENEWSGKKQIEEVYTRVVDNLLKAEMAARKGDKEAEKAALDDVKEDRIPLFTLVVKANRDFKSKYVSPLLAPLGAAWEKKATTINEGRDRKEIVSSAAPVSQPAPQLKADTADDVWDNMVKSADQERRLAA